jgi:urease subunit gamma/beta
MRQIPWEVERLQLFAAAELARRHRAAGLRLNHPEAVALICDAMLEAARSGAGYAAVEAAGRAAVDPADVLDGVRGLLDEVRLEVLLGDGTRVVALVDPLGRGTPPDPLGPGALVPGDDADVELNDGRETIELAVTSRSRRRIRVSSHYPFDRVNGRLEFDRAAARGFHLDLPSGGYAGWEPGETKVVRLVRVAGELGGDRSGDGGRDVGTGR